MTFFVLGYTTLVLLVVIPIVFLIRSRLWYQQFILFIYLLSFAVVNVLGLYSLIYSVAFPVPSVINWQRTLVGFSIVPISFYLYLPMFKFTPHRGVQRERVDTLHYREDNEAIPAICLLWFIALCLVGLGAILGYESPLLLVLRNSPSGFFGGDLSTLRREATRGKVHWFMIGYNYLPLFLSSYTYVLRCRRRNLAYSLLFYVTFVCSAVLSVSFFYKEWIFWLFVSLAIAHIIIHRGVRLKVWLMVFVGILVLGVSYKVYYPFIKPIDIGRLIVHRLIEVYPMNAGIVFGLFPDRMSFLGGLSFPNPGRIFPYDQVNLSGFVYSFLYGGKGSAPVPFFVEGYANFGFLGLALFAFFGHFCVWVVHCLVSQMRMDAFRVAITTFFAVWVVRIWMTNIFYGLLDLTVLVTFVFLATVFRVIAPMFTSISRLLTYGVSRSFQGGSACRWKGPKRY